jgi:heme/copper-type cytochrome/quinol oxidase subunit 3
MLYEPTVAHAVHVLAGTLAAVVMIWRGKSFSAGIDAVRNFRKQKPR